MLNTRATNNTVALQQPDGVPPAGGLDRQVDPPVPLWAHGKARRLPAKSVLYREGAPVDRVFIIRSGVVKLLSYLPNGRARIVRLHTRDHWVGLEGLLGKGYDHTAIVANTALVHAIPIQHLQHLERNNPRELAGLLYHWHNDLVQADKWIANFSTGSIKSRVARLLEFLATLECSSSANSVELLTVCEMAEILGVTAESVSRTLAEFKRNDILQKQSIPLREIYRLDTGRLALEAQH